MKPTDSVLAREPFLPRVIHCMTHLFSMETPVWLPYSRWVSQKWVAYLHPGSAVHAEFYLNLSGRLISASLLQLCLQQKRQQTLEEEGQSLKAIQQPLSPQRWGPQTSYSRALLNDILLESLGWHPRAII